jgi:hypothetical protein
MALLDLLYPVLQLLKTITDSLSCEQAGEKDENE